ncbi:MAG: hypothetical protein A3D31_14405 [Candidatus Fluviicola riflensis]|nr:MAG: hypothetical protein CHH17_18840 [Candidatus Fluviicola riflensis]OGS78161.1 MAG: hypothetical protein A3D31_14405 [Candidatus Fluviicola riflensis]OGS85227.1 MAG: hypothetical protein A2724_11340 [Fluviicola sp. RIFCSPHIGHO2_01_FULL_43_53]OGS89498.1 MAG: hypothetical protein A3E30_05645 [Fluviicola sp. RIFCSPHIGHO2_12_FULL_43_24]
MQFIRLSTLRQQFPAVHFPVAVSDQDALREAFYANECASQNSIPEKEQWLISLQSEEFVLFLDWTEQERNLASLLDENGPILPFQNTTRVLSHALFSRFQQFITPFLSKKLDKLMQVDNMDAWRKGMTYLVLLNEREADMVQSTVYEHLRQQHASLKPQILKARSENELHELLRKNFTPQLVELLNLFTVSFYRVKTMWVETLVEIAHHKHSSKRLVLYLISELNQLTLNADHLQELRDMERMVKNNNVKVESTKTSIKKIIAIAASLIVLVVLIGVIWWLPTEPERDKPQEKTAFMDFTPEERATMDSLLHQVKQQREATDNQIDRPDMDYVGEELIVNIPWSNLQAEELISRWREKDSLGRTPLSADSKKDDRSFPMTETLKSKTGTVTAKFQNDTQLSVFIMIFKDREDEWVYSGYVEKGGITTFKLNPGEQILVLPGSRVPRDLDYDDLPFYQVDSRFFESLEKPYTVSDFSPKKVKLVWKALNSYDFYLLDVSGALNV